MLHSAMPEGVLQPVRTVDRMHLERRDPHEEARPRELVLQLMRAQHVADVLAQETFDALAELLRAIDVVLLPLPLGAFARLEGRAALVHLVVPRHVRHQVLDHREGLHRTHGIG
jgi:hypothetical protein